MNVTTLSCQECGKAARIWLSKKKKDRIFCSVFCRTRWQQRNLAKPKRGPKVSKERLRKMALKAGTDNMTDAQFFASSRWKVLRYEVFMRDGAQCAVCGRSQRDNVKVQVDHIKPRYYHPELQWEKTNLQVLCADCNQGKGAWDETDWREEKNRKEIKLRKNPGSHLAKKENP